jgi:hypothetical protein
MHPKLKGIIAYFFPMQGQFLMRFNGVFYEAHIYHHWIMFCFLIGCSTGPTEIKDDEELNAIVNALIVSSKEAKKKAAEYPSIGIKSLKYDPSKDEISGELEKASTATAASRLLKVAESDTLCASNTRIIVSLMDSKDSARACMSRGVSA